jgi:hypothetical protein
MEVTGCWHVMLCIYTDVSEGSIALKTEGAYLKLRSKYGDYWLLECDAVYIYRRFGGQYSPED